MLLITLENLGGTVLPVNALKSSKNGSRSGSTDTRLEDMMGEEDHIQRESEQSSSVVWASFTFVTS